MNWLAGTDPAEGCDAVSVWGAIGLAHNISAALVTADAMFDTADIMCCRTATGAGSFLGSCGTLQTLSAEYAHNSA